MTPISNLIALFVLCTIFLFLMASVAFYYGRRSRRRFQRQRSQYLDVAEALGFDRNPECWSEEGEPSAHSQVLFVAMESARYADRLDPELDRFDRARRW